MEYVASISYGKDSLAMLEAIKLLGWQLDRIITAEVWATDTIQADLPPMVEFKEKADRIILERYGIQVEHFRSKATYESVFYQIRKKGEFVGKLRGFPTRKGIWCNSRLKINAINIANGSSKNAINYIGIACDEKERIERHSKNQMLKMPLVEIGWDEAYCRKWCEENDLLSPTYQTSSRGGCWFCHNQGANQLRILYHEYPNLWKILEKWDSDSPTTFKSDGRGIRDYAKRFEAEDEGLIDSSKPFRWSDVENPQLTMDWLLKNKE